MPASSAHTVSQGGLRSHRALARSTVREVAAALVIAALLVAFAQVAHAEDAIWDAGTYPDAAAQACPAGGEHDFTETIETPAGEETDGVRLWVCSKCGLTFRQAIPHTGHDWGPWVVDVSPTCATEGHEYRVCAKYPDNPHYEEQTLPRLSATGEHAWVESSRVDATCGTEGRVDLVCSVCGATRTETIPATGEHDWGDWVVDVEVTTTSTGLRHRACRVCGEVQTEEIPAIVVASPETGPGDGATPSDTGGDADSNSAAGDETNIPSIGFIKITLKPTPADTALVVGDVVVIAVSSALLVPLIARILWIRRRKRRAEDRAVDEAIQERTPSFRLIDGEREFGDATKERTEGR